MVGREEQQGSFKMILMHGKYIAQATIWKDKKVAYLHNYKVEPIADHDSSVLHWSSPHQCKITIDAPNIVEEYSAHMGGVDRKDQDTAHTNISIWTTGYYLHMFFWILYSIIHAMYVIAKDCADNINNDFGWEEYCSKNAGRKNSKLILQSR